MCSPFSLVPFFSLFVSTEVLSAHDNSAVVQATRGQKIAGEHQMLWALSYRCPWTTVSNALDGTDV